MAVGIPEVALLDLESATGTAISLNGTAPTEAGDKVIFNASNSDIWINYSSTVGSSTEPSRNVTVQITDGDVPDGLVLKVKVSKDAGQGDGTMGVAVEDPVKLGQEAKKIIEDVGTAYTGNGPNKGHNLTYILTQSDDSGSYGQIDFDQAQTLSITYTFSDN